MINLKEVLFSFDEENDGKYQTVHTILKMNQY